MSRFILPVILIAIAITAFFTFTVPMYGDLAGLREQKASYDEALTNSKDLENERDKLTQKYNAIGSDNLDKLQKMLPENVDNIRLILEIGQVAMPYGMVLKDVKYNTNTADTAVPVQDGEIQGGVAPSTNGDYGAWDLEFSTTGTYQNFISFTKDLEKNLRIVDISAIDFSSDVAPGVNSALAQMYQYNFKIKTYWLKN